MSQNNNEVLITCESVSKKFCKDFKRSLWYGIKDIGLTFSSRGQHQNSLRKDEFWAVKDINFELRRGECLGLIGHNGAGKSTLLKILNGLITPDQGKVTMKGRIGALIELGAGFNPILTGRENIYNNGAVLGFSKKEIDAKLEAIIEFSEIGEFIDAPVQNYSSGMKVRLGFAVAAQMEPDIMIIDEVLAVGDLGFVIKCLNRMGELIPNCAVIFVSHSMPMVARICNRVLLMDKGQEKLLTNDLAEGIQQYVNMFESPKRINQGTGDVELKKIEVYDKKNKKYTDDHSIKINTFDDLQLKFTLQISDDVKAFDLSVNTFDNQLRETLTCKSVINEQAFENHGSGEKTFIVTIPNMVLASGKYSITLIASDPIDKRFYCRISHAIYFYMQALVPTWATSVVPGKWVEVIGQTSIDV
ncbi:ABC transporter ATP-binding protein [Mangrovimonas sp. AS39]|uniref:ABC transporter ATP-binding protein n=1 Tax=Mangrovimonas futianensis TaxID=2895523 RepID=UPI001E4E0A68|nr:ABC transporter ATP-binding protein [Mangrovimonas futianensis]MCF1190823.1 ABC transporter ATP-binding protein [Mangrovimonas futianensis]MCF1194520.1 ABC transporter ATP-binding protein [Mangrovimonas futianensis]